MAWYVIFTLIAVVVIFMSGLLYEKGYQRFAAGALTLGFVIVLIAGMETIRKTRFDGYTSTTPEPAVYNVIFAHELSKDEILVGVHVVDSSYKRVFQLKKEWLLNKNIPFTPEHLVVSEGDEEQLVVLLR
jgi:hypothetical protein